MKKLLLIVLLIVGVFGQDKNSSNIKFDSVMDKSIIDSKILEIPPSAYLKILVEEKYKDSLFINRNKQERSGYKNTHYFFYGVGFSIGSLGLIALTTYHSPPTEFTPSPKEHPLLMNSYFAFCFTTAFSSFKLGLAEKNRIFIREAYYEILRNNNNNTIEDSFYSLLILGAQKNSSIIFKTMEEKALNAYINQIPLNSKW